MAESSSQAPGLDLAQRIVAALSRTDEPRPNPSDAVSREGNILLGTVPVHLRHLHNMYADSDDRRDNDVLHRLFWTALDTYLEQPDVPLHSTKLLSDWTVVGVPDDGRSRHGGGFGDIVMIQVGGMPGKPDGGILDFLFGGRRRPLN